MHCKMCGNIIKNPVCPDCLMEGIKSIIAEVDINNKEEVINKLSSYNNYPFNTGVECIKCHADISLCPSCFMKELIIDLQTELKVLSKIFCYYEEQLISTKKEEKLIGKT